MTRNSRTAAMVAIAIAVLVIGYVAGSARPRVTIQTGQAYSAEGAISVESDGWTYGVPLDMTWLDSRNTWHDTGRPDCLPPTGVTVPVEFGWVDVSIHEVSWREVVWVSCH